MSRRSSVSSGSVSTSVKSGLEDDPLMRDCYDLRRRLLQTEQSLQNMKPNFTTTSSEKSRPTSRGQNSFEQNKETTDSNRNYRLSPDDISHNGPSRGYSSSPESAQVLTLADLTPPTSEPNSSMVQGRKGTPLLSSLSQPFRSSLPDLRNGSTLISPRDREFENGSFGSTGDYDHDTMRKKLGRQREENTQLVNQNHKIMSELENMSYELHQAKNKVKIVTRDLEEERKRLPLLEDRIVTLESQLADQEDRSRLSERRFAECQEELQSKTEELRSVLESSNLAEVELREEARMRKRTEVQLEDAIRNVEDLSEKLADQEQSIKNIRKQHEEKERQLRDSLSQSQKDCTQALNRASSFDAQMHDFKEEIRLLHQEGLAREDTHTSMHQENASLRATISRQSQKIGRLENELRKNESYFKDSSEHLEIIERQREKIQQYQQEMADTKIHMARLEELMHRVQEQSIKEHVNTPPSTSDSGICNSTQTVNGFSSPGSNGSYLNGDISYDSDHPYSSPGKTRALVADLKLKVALKDAEIQKLQASATARAAAQQKHIAGLAGDGGTMDGLRSELSAIVERSRMGDRKQHELEQMITRLEDEVSRCSSQNIQLEERLADKMAQVASLEGKLGQRNLRVVDLQKELEDKISEINDLLREIRQKTSHVTQLERQLEDKSSEQGSRVSQLRELRDEIRGKEDENNLLREAMDDKNKELRDALSLMERSKTLQGEQSKELEIQIEQLQKKYEEKNIMSIQLETALTATRQELELRSTIAERMERTIEEQKQRLTTTESQADNQNRKFDDLSSQAEHATKQMQHLEKSLAECQQEIKIYIDQLEDARRQHEAEMRQAKDEISKLELSLKESTLDLQQKAGYIGKLEQALSERQATLQKEQERGREMHDSRIHLQQQVTLIEEEINRERNASQVESNDLHQKLQEAKVDIEQKTKELNELNLTMREMHRDMKLSSASIVELEQLLQQTRSQNDKNMAQLQTVEGAHNEAKTGLSQQTKRNGELEERLRQTEEDLKERDGHVTKLDNELTKLQGDFQDTITQLKSLEDLLDTSKRVVQEKEQKVNELDKMLNESMEEIHQKDKDLKDKEDKLAELDKALKETRKDVKTRDAQYNQLDMSMKDHQTEVKQKTMALEHNLNQSRYELSERAVEVAELKAKYDQSQDLLRQTKNRLQHYEKTARQQQDDLKKRINQLSELEQEAEKLRKRKHDSEETSQELRLSREQLQNTHGELMEARRELLRYQRREQELVQELDDAHVLLTAKEGDCTRLAKDLGATQVREAQAEARCVQEMRKSTQQNELKHVSQEKELQRLQEKYNKLLAQKEELEAEKRILTTNTQDKERQLTQELARNNDDTNALYEDNKRLTSQLALYQDDAKAMSEALVIKEAEIARLEARISGYERAMFGQNNFERLGYARPSPRPSSPRERHSRHVTSPRSLATITKSNSDYNLHNLSTGSALSYLESDDLLDYNHNVVSRAPLLRVNAEGSVSQSSRSRNRSYASPSKMSRTEMHDRSTTETIDDILREANRALHDDDPLLLTPTSTSRAHRDSSTSRDLSPPQREVIGTGSSEESGPETLKEQLEAKKAAAGLTRSSEGTPLDPSKCRASLEERLRVSEQRRKQIDKQLKNMKSTMT